MTADSTGLRDRAETIARICEETAAQADTEGDVQSRDVFALHGSIIRALLASPAPAGAEGWDTKRWGYSALFNAIAAATKIEGGNAIGISVRKFEEAMLTASPAPSPATPPAEARDLVEVSVVRMEEAGKGESWWVQFKHPVSGHTLTPHMHRIKGRSEYEAETYRALFEGRDPEDVDPLDYEEPAPASAKTAEEI